MHLASVSRRQSQPCRPHRTGRAALAVAMACLMLLSSVGGGPGHAPAAAPNDRIADAIGTGVPDLLLVDTRGATTETGEPVPSCAPPGNAPIRSTVWYTIVAHGTSLRVSTAGSGGTFRPLLALYQPDAFT